MLIKWSAQLVSWARHRNPDYDGKVTYKGKKTAAAATEL